MSTGGLWNDEDGYYYDVLRLPDGALLPDQGADDLGPRSRSSPSPSPTARRSAASAISAKRLRWFAKYRPELLRGLGDMTQRGVEDRVRLAIVDTDKLARILEAGARHRAAC